MSWGFVVNGVITVSEQTWQLLCCHAVASPCLWERSFQDVLWVIRKTSYYCCFHKLSSFPFLVKINEGFTCLTYFFFKKIFLPFHIQTFPIFHICVGTKGEIFVGQSNENPINFRDCLKNKLLSSNPLVFSMSLSQREVSGFPRWQPQKELWEGPPQHCSFTCGFVIF